MTQKIIIAFLVVVLIAGCEKKPSSLVVPPNQYSTADYPNTIAGLQSVLASGYSNLRSVGLFGFEYLAKAMANITHTGNSNYGGDAGWQEMTNTSLTVTNDFSNDAFSALYTGIKNCNLTLADAAFYNSKYAQPGDSATVSLIEGQAYFLRGYYYFELECLYGEDNILNPTATDTMGVPIITQYAVSLAATQVGRSSIKSVWAQIESDLTQAATLLHGQVWTGNDIGRASEWAAKGLLGKAYVFTKDYTDAKTSLLDVINNSGKSLMPYAQYRDAFIGITANKFNQESLFELNVDQNSQGNYGIFGGTANAATTNGLIWSPNYLSATGTEVGSQSLGYGNEVIHDQNLRRFGFSLPAYQLVTNPNFNASLAPGITNPPQVMDPTYKQQSLAIRANMTADPRLYVCCLQPWVDSVEYDGVHWSPVSKHDAVAPDPQSVMQWSFRKYAPIFNNMNNVGQADACDYYILRLADVYLLYAEACANSGDNADALEYLNKVKRRAYSYPVNSPSPIDYTSLSGNTVAINDPVLGTNPLYYERWAELFNEGQWWFDICRWHLGPSEAAYYVTADNLSGHPQLVFADKTYAWPIPLAEINANSAISKQQNPGY